MQLCMVAMYLSSVFLHHRYTHTHTYFFNFRALLLLNTTPDHINLCHLVPVVVGVFAA